METTPPPLEVVPDARLGVAASSVCFADRSRRQWWRSLLEGVIFGLVLFVGSWALLGDNGFFGALIGYVLTWLWLCVIRTRRARSRIAAIWTSPPYRLSVDEKGILAASGGGSYWRSWDRVSKLVERPEWVTLVLDGLETLTIPQAAFANAERRENWLRYVRECIAEGKAA